MYIAGKAPLPQELRGVVLEYFRRKTLLKGVDQYNYMKSKNNLIGIFGMAYTDIVREEVVFQDGRWLPPDELEKPDIGEILQLKREVIVPVKTVQRNLRAVSVMNLLEAFQEKMVEKRFRALFRNIRIEETAIVNIIIITLKP